MIPYFAPPKLELGPLTLDGFGILAALGILLAAGLMMRAARQEGKDPQLLNDYAIWGVGAGVVVGHWVHLFLYHPEELSKGVLQIFKFWDGLSSFGGLLGGLLAAAVFFRSRGVPFHSYADALALGVAPGWAVARIGCFLVHDHPGVRTDFFLAVQFPGGARHDLGLYDALLLFACTAVLYGLRRAGKLRGRLLPLLALMYAPGRFLFDFLRATDLSYVDRRYFGLTPAQYGCIALIAYGIWGLARLRGTEPAARRARAATSSPSR